MAVWCGLAAHIAAHATMRVLGESTSDLMDLTSGHVGNYTGRFYTQVCEEPLAGNLTFTAKAGSRLQYVVMR